MDRHRNTLILTTLFALCSTARGQSVAPGNFEARFSDSMNIHIGNQEGAINRRREVRISLQLLAGGKLVGTDSGVRAEHNLYSNYSTNDETKWTNRWTGTWTASDGALRLDLTLGDRSCARTKTMSDQPGKEQLPCLNVSTQLHFECKSEHVKVEASTGRAATPEREQAAWRCQTAGPAELGDTPQPWLFGQQAGAAGCIETLPGFRSFKASYRHCAPDAPTK